MKVDNYRNKAVFWTTDRFGQRIELLKKERLFFLFNVSLLTLEEAVALRDALSAAIEEGERL